MKNQLRCFGAYVGQFGLHRWRGRHKSFGMGTGGVHIGAGHIATTGVATLLHAMWLEREVAYACASVTWCLYSPLRAMEE